MPEAGVGFFKVQNIVVAVVLFVVFKIGIAAGIVPPHIAKAPLPAVVVVCLVCASLLTYRG